MLSQRSKLQGIAALYLAVVFLSVSLTSVDADAGAIIRGRGMLTSIEKGEIVMIDKKGYFMDSSTRIIDIKGEPIPLEYVSLPARVNIKYVYTTDGPLIKVIKVLPKNMAD